MADDPGIELQRVEPRLFGRVPPAGLLGAGVALLLAAIALLATGHWLIGPALLVLSLVALGLFLVAASHLPPSRITRGAVGGMRRVRDELRFAGTSARAWTSAGRQVLALHRELQRLGRERDAVQHELGAAVYREHEDAVAELRARMHELDEGMEACAARITRARRDAEQQVLQARAPLSSTEILKPGRKV